MQARFLMTVIAIMFLAATVDGAAQTAAQFPSLISMLNAVKKMTLCSEKVPLESQEVRERMEKELLLTVWNRSQVLLWLKRSRRYLPIIEKMLAESDMPDDLKFVAIAESALRPHAGSRKGAVGFWQFMPSTARKYGLTVNRRFDERRNIFLSTRAAIKYLKDLYDEFGSWALALAAYNMGEEGMKAEILAQGTDDYYRLYLPLETQRFIFRILAVKLIIANPAGHGFHLTDKDFYPPLIFETVEIDISEEVPLQIIARAADTNFKTIKDLNPHIRGHYLAKGQHPVHIPGSASADFMPRYRKLADKYLLMKRERIYVVQSGDNLSSIAQEFDVPLAALLIWNRLDLKRPIRPGQRLIIYPNGYGGEKVDTAAEIESNGEESDGKQR